jgi:Ca2+-transporting ATPase
MTNSSAPSRTNAHTLPIEEVAAALSADLQRGLTSEEADRRLVTQGANILIPKDEVSLLRRFLAQFVDPQMYLLLGATVLSMLVSLLRAPRSLPAEALFILAVAVANAFLGFVQELRAEKALSDLKQLQPFNTQVIRDGAIQTIPTARVVTGDLIFLTEGHLIAADGRVIRTSQLSVSESILTGESEAVRKLPSQTPLAVPLAERTNMVYSGTSVISGEGVALVCATGAGTEIGQISSLISSAEDMPTLFQQRFTTLSKQLAVAVILVGAVTVLGFAAVVRHPTPAVLLNILLFGVSLGVAAAPEALGTIITLALAVAAHRMARAGAIVRQLSVMDTLGGVSIILCDKTGTLTANRMSVATVYADGRAMGGLKTDIVASRQEDGLSGIALAAAVANEAHPTSSEDKTPFTGDPLDVALREFAVQAGVTSASLQQRFHLLEKLPFTSERKMMTSFVEDLRLQGRALYSKGAPEYLLDRCTQEQRNRKVYPLTVARRSQILQDVAQLSDRGEKVIALATKVCSNNIPAGPCGNSGELADEEHDFTFLGLIGLIDPPRTGVANAIEGAHRAGIRTIIVSGDHPRTALSVARRAGITDNALVITGAELRHLSDSELSSRLADCSVLARIDPEDKLRVARVLQQSGDIVAMTGDGVNDAPALKAADVGIAMGSGTDIAKETADIVLTDDNFETIVRAIGQGRVLASNIAKAVTYLFTTNLCEVITLFVVAIASATRAFHSSNDLVLPLTTPQILWINLITDAAPAIALALAPPSRDVMVGKDPQTSRKLLTASSLSQVFIASMLMALMTLLVYFHAVQSGASVEYQRTVTLTTLIFSQAVYAVSVQTGDETLWTYFKSLSWLHGAIVLSLGLHIAVLLVPATRQALGLAQLDARSWMWCSGASLSVLLGSEALKALRPGTFLKAIQPHAGPLGSSQTPAAEIR